MRIAIYGRKFNDSAIQHVQQLIDSFLSHEVEITIYAAFHAYLAPRVKLPAAVKLFSQHHELINQVDCLVSIGGDGTLLDTVTLVRDSGIPVIGINMGRLGFLASIAKTEIATAVDSLVKGHFTIDKRSLIKLESNIELFNGVNYGLNDLTIHKKDTSSMIIIHTYLNGEFLNSYWADGLIVATPTGSTGYNMSCNGPILFPESSSFVITPVAPHNLNVRSVVVPDSSVISFEIEGRTDELICALDARKEIVPIGIQIAVKKEAFCVHFIRLNENSYLTTLRTKLTWGLDKRN